ncbi:MAG: hypothetical protein ACJ8DI_02435 [Ktedonobacteraceae bacterium]
MFLSVHLLKVVLKWGCHSSGNQGNGTRSNGHSRATETTSSMERVRYRQLCRNPPYHPIP